MYKFLIPLFALAFLIGCTQSETQPMPPLAEQPTQGQEYRYGFDGTLLSGTHTVTIKTNKGDITLELYADEAPKTVTNFVHLAKTGYYDDLIFHRVIPGFMIQGGDPNGNGTGGESIFGDTFEDEINDMKMVRGVIAMANRGPNTNGSQFFIATGKQLPWLDGRHTVFGKVIEGQDVVDEISFARTDENDKPVDPISFEIEAE